MRGINRREFLGAAVIGGAAWYFSRNWPLASAGLASPGGFFDGYGPIDRSLGEKAPGSFFGDSFNRSHAILWDVPSYLKKHPAPTVWESQELVVVGGGLSGLFSAYTFRDRKPVVLEQAARFGGNAKGQSWRGIDYGLGSAYFPTPTTGTPFYRAYKELGLDKIVQTAPAEEPVGLAGKLTQGFWEGAAEPQHRAVYLKLAAHLREVFESKRAPFPQIPPTSASELARVKDLDKKNFAQALEDAVGKLPPLLSHAIDSYCWSAFAASPREISAAAGYCFLAAESAPLCVAPGGNAGVAEHILKQTLNAGVPSSHLRAACTVVKVSAEGDQVRILYEASDKTLRGIVAKAVIMACPQFVAAKILSGIEPERLAAIQQIDYRSYLTAAVLIDKPLQRRFYDLFLVADAGASAPSRETLSHATDVIVGSLGQARGRNTVLTMYRAMPSSSARAQLMRDGSYATAHADFEKQIETELLPLLGFGMQNVKDLRIARWGHALPVPTQGAFAKDLPAVLSKPFANKVFFVEQDNWLTPSIETGVGALELQKAAITAALEPAKLATRPK